jgi:HEPN domain-containing protein
VAVISYLEYSNRDMKYAADMLKLENYDPCGRFCQQSVEKRLKHFIEKNGNTNDLTILHSHNLAKLYTRVCEISGVKTDRAVRGDLYQLTTYYYDTNYPSEDNIELTNEMAEEAVKIAGYVNDWVDSLGS